MPKKPTHGNSHYKTTKHKPRGRTGPTTPEGKAISSMNNAKYGGYTDCFLECKVCPAKDSCARKGELKWMGLDICIYEQEIFDSMISETCKEFNITLRLDIEMLKRLVMGALRAKRAERYLKKDGLIVKGYVKNDKTGEVKEVEAQHTLKRDMYYSEKNLKEWLTNLKLARDSRDDSTQKVDLAIRFTK